MSGDKRTVATDALDTLGTVPLDGSAKRDAIHLAVEPVIAGVSLLPGERVCIEAGVATSAGARPHLGIVDPFLDRPVTAGERFWFVMNPRTVTSLRHVWAHPAFADEPVVGAPEVSASENWLRGYCGSHDVPPYEEMLVYLRQHDGTGSLYIGDHETSENIPVEFWVHASIVTGRQFKYDYQTYFSCSC